MPDSVLFYIIPGVAIALTAYGFSKKQGQETEEAPRADSLGDVAVKIKTLLDSTKKKFGDKYSHVKLSVTLPALLQLITQAEASRSSASTSSRDGIFNKAGRTATAKGEILWT
jgi:hypothetical protein